MPRSRLFCCLVFVIVMAGAVVGAIVLDVWTDLTKDILWKPRKGCRR